MSKTTVFFSDVFRLLDDFFGMTAPSKSVNERKLIIDSLPRNGISEADVGCEKTGADADAAFTGAC